MALPWGLISHQAAFLSGPTPLALLLTAPLPSGRDPGTQAAGHPSWTCAQFPGRGSFPWLAPAPLSSDTSLQLLEIKMAPISPQFTCSVNSKESLRHLPHLHPPYPEASGSPASFPHPLPTQTRSNPVPRSLTCLCLTCASSLEGLPENPSARAARTVSWSHTPHTPLTASRPPGLGGAR